MHTKFIFVTGGVVSSLGKGITSPFAGVSRLRAVGQRFHVGSIEIPRLHPGR